MIPEQNPHWFDNFFDSIYQLTAILDKNGRILKANHTILNTTGLPLSAIIGKHFWEVRWSALSRQNRQVIKQAVRQASRGKFVREDLDVHPGKQSNMVIDLTLKPIYDKDANIEFILAEGQNITDDKLTREALFRSEARFQTVFEEAGIGIVIKSVDGEILDANPAFLTMLGYTAEELKTHSYLDITHPRDKAASQALFNELINGKRKSYTVEKRYCHKDGQDVWGSNTSSVVYGPDGRPLFVIGMVENISAQKQIESELEELRNRLMYGREMERLRIAQDLHDGPLQEVIGISYQLQALENSLAKDADIDQYQSILSALQLLAKSIRVMCGELRPPTLIPFGLEKTILSNVEEIQSSHPELEVKLDLTQDGQSLPEQQRVVLFRVYQEAFHNILRHSQATTAWVRYCLKDAQAVLEVQDNGTGFKTPKRWIEFARQGHLGLVGAMERTREAGGSLEITSAPGQGTLIRATVPLAVEDSQTQNPNERGRYEPDPYPAGR